MHPSLEIEKSFFEQGKKIVAGIDEVGRGCLAGPVSIGVCLVSPPAKNIPKGLQDSKLISAKTREELVPQIKNWALDYAIGHSSNKEIDAFGLSIALRLAAGRALAGLASKPDAVILDGKHNWLLGKDAEIFQNLPTNAQTELDDLENFLAQSTIVTKIKADQSCASVAAASVLAKVERDDLITQLANNYKEYGWDSNKGYASAGHLNAIEQLGPTEYHRISWKPFI
jgi:ribonuclease HII